MKHGAQAALRSGQCQPLLAFQTSAPWSTHLFDLVWKVSDSKLGDLPDSWPSITNQHAKFLLEEVTIPCSSNAKSHLRMGARSCFSTYSWPRPLPFCLQALITAANRWRISAIAQGRRPLSQVVDLCLFSLTFTACFCRVTVAPVSCSPVGQDIP